MAFELLDNRNRAVGAGAALAINALLFALLLTLSRGLAPPSARGRALTTVDISPPPPPPARQQDKRAAAPAGPASRGATRAPSPPNPPRPLPKPTPAQPAPDAGNATASGAGTTAGTGEGQGGQGKGSGSGGNGYGNGGGMASPPVHLAGELSDRDYARSGVPRGAGGTVVIGFRVRSDGGVDRCNVVSTSGYGAIDEATCRLVEERFRFRPALDGDGRPIDYNLRTDFTWRPR